MILYLETAEGFVPWRGEPIAGVVYPTSIGTVWSSAELAAVGLFEPYDPGIPEGYREVSRSVGRDETDRVTFVYETEVIPALAPSDVHLTMRQLRLGLLLIGGYPADFLQTTISAIPDPTERAVAQIWYEETSEVEWDHPMTQSLITAAGINQGDAVAMWLQAKDLAA